MVDVYSRPTANGHKITTVLDEAGLANTKRLDDFPSLKRRFETICAKPATIAACAKAEAISQPKDLSGEAQKVRFGQAGPFHRQTA